MGAIRPLGDRTEHYWLVQRMARVLGCDTAKAREDGRLDAEEWSAMVTRCRGCTVTCACRAWLARAELDQAGAGRSDGDGEPLREAAIEGCENALVFATI